MSLSAIFFFLLGILAIASAILTVASKNPVMSALSLVFNFFMLAGLYLTLQAQFVAVIQILVYAGAIMVLVIFVIMLLNLGDEKSLKEKFNWRKGLAILVAAGLAVQFVVAFFATPSGNVLLPEASAEIGTPASIGNVLFNDYLLPFEAISLLLLVAIIGSVILAKRRIEN